MRATNSKNLIVIATLVVVVASEVVEVGVILVILVVLVVVETALAVVEVAVVVGTSGAGHPAALASSHLALILNDVTLVLAIWNEVSSLCSELSLCTILFRSASIAIKLVKLINS